jgi:hypothetical protein
MSIECRYSMPTAASSAICSRCTYDSGIRLQHRGIRKIRENHHHHHHHHHRRYALVCKHVVQRAVRGPLGQQDELAALGADADQLQHLRMPHFAVCTRQTGGERENRRQRGKTQQT